MANQANDERNEHALAPRPSKSDRASDQSHNSPEPSRARARTDERTRIRNGRIQGWRDRFATAHQLDQRLRLLNEFGLTDSDIAQAVPRAKARSIRRWRTERPPTSRLGERWTPIDDLCAIIGIFVSDASYDEDAIVAWLRSRQPELDDERPLQVIADGGFDAVRRAVQHRLALPSGKTDELVTFRSRGKAGDGCS
jgi:hypothetical protein